MAASSSNESTPQNDTASADRNAQVIATSAAQSAHETELTAGRMRLDMNEILGLKRG
ncbi:MAG: hypothetical protein ABJB74_17415 [Gemmatimonas sp.]